MNDFQIKFGSYLSKRGLKHTEPRRQIVETVFAFHDHFDAEQLYERVKQVSSDVSRATVYRTITLLVDSGLVQKSLRSSARDLYEHIYGHDQHVHWVCRRCGSVQETPLDEVRAILARGAGDLKFKLEEINLNLNGLCWKCRQDENENQ